VIYTHSKFLNIIFAETLVLNVANITTEMELIGIKIAATTGSRFPEIANAKPTILYRKLIKNAVRISLRESFEKRKNSGRNAKFLESKIASQEGEKLLISSDI